MKRSSPILWRRLDVPGHDAAVLVETRDGAELRGMAVFRDQGGPTALDYRVRCSAGWQTSEAHIRGWLSARPVQLSISRDDVGRWTLDRVVCPAVAGCVDLDLSFTPATNLLPLRRLGLMVGDTAELRSAWLDWPAGTLAPLVQRYTRHSTTTYGYEADLPGGDRFVAELRVDPDGWVIDYPGLWQAESVAPRRHEPRFDR
jgi:hypothetical protein